MFQTRSIYTKTLSVFLVSFLSTICLAVLPSTEFVYLGCPSWQAEFDSAGYSDCFYWGYSVFHQYDSHEMLSGEWAAAIYYDGIDTNSNQAKWLTDYFLYPFITTNSNFIFVDVNSFDDPNNAITPYDGFVTNYHGTHTAYDTAQSIIANNNIRVTIDYEMVDLGQNGYSPLSFVDSNGAGYVHSDRYILLKTYTIKNISDSNITGLEFYQMLCGYSTYADKSSYSTASFADDLASYTPWNSIHKKTGTNYAGNFKYDITQWGTLGYDPDHIDYINFGSTIEPNIIDNDIFTGEDTGTYLHIMNRNLNGQTSSTGEVAGAMGWNLGTLTPGQSTKITLAVMFGRGDITRYPVSLTKVDDVIDGDAVLPGQRITYTINYNYPASFTEDINNVVIVDYLPDAMWFGDVNTFGGTYDMLANTVTWTIGTLSPGDSGTLTVSALANNIESGMTLENRAELAGDFPGKAVAIEHTYIPCWNVRNITQSKAYCEIQDAIDDADSNDVIEIQPGTYNETLTISNKPLTLQGQNQYDWQTVSNTIIDLGRNNFNITGSNKTYIKGLTIRNGSANIYSENSNTSIENCISEGSLYGIINGNDSLTISNCIIRNNDYFGIFFENCNSSSSVIENCLIYDNGNNSECGIYLKYSEAQTFIKNCTITKNYNGIKNLGSTAPNVMNSIIHGNNVNTVGSVSLSYCTTTADPCFYDEDANNFHITTDSACINAGNPFGTYSDYDIDGEDRVISGRIDIGMDECYRSKADFNHDEIVNFVDYARLAASWNINDANVALGADNLIGYDDLTAFCADWLWEPSYLNSQNQMMMPIENLMIESSMELQAESASLMVSAETEEIPVDVDSLVDWLDEVWLSGELSDAMTEEEYLEFKETIEQSGNTGISENQ